MDGPRRTQPNIDRRTFAKAAIATGAALGAGGLSSLAGCAGDGATPRRPDTPPRPNGEPFPLHEWDIARLQDAMARGELSAAEITALYLARIDAIDRRGPTLRSVIETNPAALEIARHLDEERAGADIRGPLHGIPIIVKDNIDTADRMQTTAGSLALEGHRAGRDAFIVERLREAGAVILAKANLSEWANFRSTRSTSGWSARGGQCANPYALDRNPCGSSSGSGAAASANLCAVAVGTETDGSIVCPASTCGIVGIKPTVGVASRSGIIPISRTQDTAGPMARTVRDAAILLTALAWVDPDDPETRRSAGRVSRDYTRFLDPDGLEGARIGVYRAAFGFDPDVDSIVEAALGEMADAGAIIIDPVESEALRQVGQHEWEVLLYEFKAGIDAYLARADPPSGVRSLADLIEFNRDHADLEMPFFGQEIFEMALEKGPLTEEAYREALRNCRRMSRTDGIDKMVREHDLDAIVAPTNGPAWKTDLACGDHYLGGSSTAAAVAGYPNVTVPAGFAHGLPIGVSFFGQAWSEGALLRIAYDFEQRTTARRAPTLAESLALAG